MSTLIKKLSAKTVMSANIRKMEDGELFKIFGAAVDVKAGESSYGSWEALKGTFKAVRVDGEEFTSSICFLPESAHDMVANQLKASEKKTTVEFAFEIGRKTNDDILIGYEYTVKPLIEIEQESDPIARLMDKVNNQTKKGKK